MGATYAKLNTGAWGVRVAGPKPVEGVGVLVTKRDGTAKTEVIERVLWSGQGVYLCAIAPKGAARNVGAGSGTVSRSRAWRPCGYPGCSPRHCDECG